MKALEEMFANTGALQKGHFRLTSGLHSDIYLQCALVLQHPDRAHQMAEEMARLLGDVKPDVVVGPAMGGVTWAYQLGLTLGCRALFAERSEDVMSLRRGFSVKPGEKVLVAEDVSTTGGSAMEVIRLLEGYRANILGVALIVDRTAGKLDFGVPYWSLYQIEPKVWRPADCPQCQAGIPTDKPGSR